MRIWQSFRKANRELFKNWPTYLITIWGSSAVVILAATLLLTHFTNWLLKVSQIPYLSYSDLGQLLSHNFWVALILLGELILLLYLIYGQFAFVLMISDQLQHRQFRRITSTLYQTFKRLKSTSPLAFLIFISNFIIILPPASLLLSTPLINKLKIPGPILDFLLQNPPYAVIVGILYLILCYLALRLSLMLPLILLKQLSCRQAGQLSWQKTKKQFGHFLGELMLIVSFSLLLTAIFDSIIYLLQSWLDTTSIALNSVIVNLFLIELFAEIITCYLVAMISQLLVKNITTSTHQPTFRPPAFYKWLVILLVLVGVTGLVTNQLLLLKQLTFSRPLTISHRGVDNGNGVQNTIPALKQTSQEKPDYVEIDIQQTKDQQFVVLHDDNLKTLAGLNKSPHQLTLQQLTQITVRENGHQAKLASFDDYLAAAKKLNQKLLIEIKATPTDSKDMTAIFIRRYQKQILKNHHLVQTLSYPVVTQLKQQAPQLFVSFILPYNLTLPVTKANAYTMEATTLNAKFIRHAQQQKQQVYAWTVNKPQQMDHMMFIGAKAIITDQLHGLKQQIKRNRRQPNYASLLRSLMVPVTSSEANKTN
ncbi:glycerophosphoryl diester phosphodiesterase membrane domain-containing protein [Lapidilactobacillus dextrinicus]|uniref:glycerophosphoryl diester phosphodiesterase membrane domain-containing protein n=1 Tax=Lapidilactobacillus dextrinicus TaxID=51664 RepID=UPI003F26227E